MAFTLNGWKRTASTLLISRLPLQTFDTALPLVESYLSNAGGWTPDDPNDPTGNGEPANQATPDIAVTAIIVDQGERMYRLSATVSVDLKVEFLANLAPNQSDSDVLAQMQPMLQNFVERQFNKVPIRFDSMNNVVGDITTQGDVSPLQRREIRQLLIDGDHRADPRASALFYSKRNYVLDDTWNVTSYYTEANKPIMVIIEKYTDDQFTAIDTGSDRRYVISVSPTDYSITGGIVITQ